MTRLAENSFRVSTLRWALYNFADTLQTPCSFDDIGVENVFSVERGPSLGDATRLLFTVPAAAAAVDLVTRVVSVAMIGPYNAMRTFSLSRALVFFSRR